MRCVVFAALGLLVSAGAASAQVYSTEPASQGREFYNPLETPMLRMPSIVCEAGPSIPAGGRCPPELIAPPPATHLQNRYEPADALGDIEARSREIR